MYFQNVSDCDHIIVTTNVNPQPFEYQLLSIKFQVKKIHKFNELW